MRTTALNAHPPCAEDTGRAGAQAPGVRVLCRNPHSRSQRTPCPAPPPAQSRRREVGEGEGVLELWVYDQDSLGKDEEMGKVTAAPPGRRNAAWTLP